ncbi:GNAT family N-acetyltransferase [Entomospira entomophila]|uniref:GNAT family N-acetyltransferase n=1 Tax=Entomospira entomophila TaxID=2719988 RepID=A0A968KU16_9SPIO|nr:GNAT family N-acetyltransferase [Entomospira entomophilus]NIZ40966.1 GNAT family N-acetyltransferase [Entomospira entomophilus]WDI35179.1 GNAT family N-acetyltransferase [Entomospira entomophilus]
MRKDNTPTLETERLILRKFTEQDVPYMWDLYSNDKAMQFIPRFPFQTLDHVYRHLYQVILPYYTKDVAYYYAIEEKRSGHWIGYMILSNIGKSNDLGYALAPNYWYQGFIHEAGLALIRHLKMMQFPFISATHDMKNPNSGRVMRKLGLQYQYCYQEFWIPKNIWVTFLFYQYNFQPNIPQYRGYIIETSGSSNIESRL